MNSFRIASLRVGTPRVLGGGSAPNSSTPDSEASAIPDQAGGRSFESSILKSPQTGPLEVGREGLSGDAQADTRHHGGRDKAICVYPAEHYPRWAEELGREGLHDAASLAVPGAVGENLTLEGVNESTIAIGDRLRAPSGLVLEVSQPRVPCWKVARRWGVKDMADRMISTGRTGWYCRVLETGSISVGEALTGVGGTHPAWTVERTNRVYYATETHEAEAWELAEVSALSAATRETVYRKLDAQAYVPLACAVHDVLEDAAVRRVPLDFELTDPTGGTESVRTEVRDWRAERGAEFVELEGGRLIRLDRIVRVATVRPG